MATSLKVHAAIACDDVRLEMGGKWIAIGIYGPDLMTPIFPVALPLRLVAIVEILEAGIVPFSFRVLGPDKNILMSVNGNMEAPRKGKGLFMPIGAALVPLSAPGDFVLQFEASPEKWRTIQTWSVGAQPLGVLPQPQTEI